MQKGLYFIPACAYRDIIFGDVSEVLGSRKLPNNDYRQPINNSLANADHSSS